MLGSGLLMIGIAAEDTTDAEKNHHGNPLKRQSRLQQMTNFATSFLKGMLFHENRLPADDSHEISCLICCF